MLPPRLSELPMTKGSASHHHSPTPFPLLSISISLPHRKTTSPASVFLTAPLSEHPTVHPPKPGYPRSLDAYRTVPITAPRRPNLRPGSDPVDAAAPALKLCDLHSAAWPSPMIECQSGDAFRLGNSPHPHPSIKPVLLGLQLDAGSPQPAASAIVHRGHPTSCSLTDKDLLPCRYHSTDALILKKPKRHYRVGLRCEYVAPSSSSCD